MNFNFQAINDHFDELEELSAKYSEYQGLPVSQIQYQDARNDEDKKKARKVGLHYDILMTVFFVVFAIVTVLTFIGDTGILLKLLLVAITGLIGFLLFKSLLVKPKVAYGKAIYKQRRLVGHVGSRRSAKRYVYLVTFIPDGDEKVLYKGVQVSRKDFEQIQEGTPIMVVNKGHQACIL